jgi:hypothetical protein
MLTVPAGSFTGGDLLGRELTVRTIDLQQIAPRSAGGLASVGGG